MDGAVGMILAAGLGTRLRPLTDLLPKPAVPVAGVPLVQHAFGRMRDAGIRRVVVNTHHLAGEMARVAAAAAQATGLELSLSHEPVIAGTGGALREARRFLSGAEAIVLWNGDVLFDIDLGGVVEAHRRSGALATMVLAPVPPGAAFATVDVDGAMVVRRIAGLGPGGDGLLPLHFTGVHVLSPAILEHVPERPHACDVNRQVHVPLLPSGRVRGVVTGGYWNDLGPPERYLRANLDLLARLGDQILRDGSASVDPEARLAGPAIIGRDAVVLAGAAIGPGTVLGEGSRVGRGAQVESAVVWPGTVVAPGERVVQAVAAGSLRVPAGPAAGG